MSLWYLFIALSILHVVWRIAGSDKKWWKQGLLTAAPYAATATFLYVSNDQVIIACMVYMVAIIAAKEWEPPLLLAARLLGKAWRSCGEKSMLTAARKLGVLYRKLKSICLYRQKDAKVINR